MKKQILIVDNHPIILEFLSGLLENNGYEVRTAGGGLSALETLETYRPDFIFIDLIMPHIGGERLCKIIRNKFDRSGYNPILIIVSATAKEEIGENGVPDFADIFIAKGPFAKMGSHVLETLKRVEKEGIQGLRAGVIGIKDVFHREITKELLIVKKHQDIVLKRMTDGFMEMTSDLTIVHANPAAAEYLDIPESRLISMKFCEAVPEADLHKLSDFSITVKGRHLSIRIAPSDNDEYQSHLVIIHDESEKKKIELALKEKELLLHELHHRVKNNLTMLTSLINLQKDYVENNQELHHLERLHHRIHSVSLAYHTLMTRDNIAIIDFGEYARQLVDDILSTMMLPKNQIVTTVEADSVSFEIETMIPLGLIVTELFTNAVQHGYPLETQLSKPVVGNIKIGLEKIDTRGVLTVANDGAPFPSGIDFKNTKSLGLKLACVLSEQLDGAIELERQEKSTAFTVSFPLPQ